MFILVVQRLNVQKPLVINHQIRFAGAPTDSFCATSAITVIFTYRYHRY